MLEGAEQAALFALAASLPARVGRANGEMEGAVERCAAVMRAFVALGEKGQVPGMELAIGPWNAIGRFLCERSFEDYDHMARLEDMQWVSAEDHRRSVEEVARARAAAGAGP